MNFVYIKLQSEAFKETRVKMKGKNKKIINGVGSI